MGIGNLIGFNGGAKPSGGGNLFGLGGSGSQASKKVIRNVDWKNSKLKEKARNFGIVKVNRVEKINGKNVVTREVIEKSNIVDFLKKGVKSGQPISSYKYNFDKKHTMIDQKSGGKVKYIFSRDSALDRKKSDKIRDIYDKDGPTKQKMAAKLQNEERTRKRNILTTQFNREDEERGMSDQLRDRRKKEVKESIDIRIGNRKVGAKDIGVERSEYSVAAQAGNGGLNKVSKSGFANKIENPEDKQGNVADLSGDKAKGINEANDTPMFRPSADK